MAAGDGAIYLGLFLATFVQEGLAIAAGAALIIERGSPPLLVFAALWAGMIAGDLTIFGIGALARHHPWARRIATDRRVMGATNWLHRNLLTMIALSRVVPGILFPTFITYGWSGLPLTRFAPLAIASAGIYASLLLTVFATFGENVVPWLGHWTWAVVAAAVFMLIVFALRTAARHLRASLQQ